MNIKQTLLGCTLASFMFAACSSDDSSTGGSSGSCDVSALPASNLSFESTSDGCLASQSMDADAFMSVVAAYTNAGWLPVTANSSPDGQSGDYVFSKQEGSVTHTVTLTNSAGAVTAVYVKTGDEQGGKENSGTKPGSKDNVPNASQCDLATKRLPASALAWTPTFAGGCEVLQEFALADLQALDEELLDMGYFKQSLSAESYKYVLDDWSKEEGLAFKDTLAFVYAMGTFTGTFSSASRALTKAEKVRLQLFDAYFELVTADLLGGDPTPYVETNVLIDPLKDNEYLYVYGKMPFTQVVSHNQLVDAGWSCSVAGAITCKKELAGVMYYLSYRIDNNDSPSQRKIRGYFSLDGATPPK
jgi:hypothetical protein